MPLSAAPKSSTALRAAQTEPMAGQIGIEARLSFSTPILTSICAWALVAAMKAAAERRRTETS
jgi:hypothetical protein